VLPFLILFRTVGLLDTQVALVLAYAGFNLPLAVWITRDFFAALPRDIEDSALIDGASRWQAFLRIALPLSVPGVVAAFAICFIFTWNEYLIALMLTYSRAQTLPIYLAGHGYGAALTIVCVVPPLLVGLSCERFLTRRLFGSAVK
jgi:multiple sugar transport system permease protein